MSEGPKKCFHTVENSVSCPHHDNGFRSREVGMKRSFAPVLVLWGLCLLGSGCLVRSLYPWLSEETRVADPSLAGAWQDVEKECIVFFNANTATNYDVLMVQEGEDISRFSASLHRIGETLLLQVAPENRTDLGAFATLPGHLLYKAVPEGDSLRLYAVDLDSFAERAQKSGVAVLPDSAKDKGFILLPPTGDLEAFVRTQLPEPGFFGQDPFFSFHRLPAKAD